MENRHSAVLRDGFADQLRREFIAAGLVGENAQKMQGVAVARVGLQNLPVKTFRLAQVSGLMKP